MKRIFCFLMTLSLSLLPVLYASGEAGIPPVHPEQDIDPGEDTSQDDYWAGSGLEFLWDTLYLKDPQPLSDEEQRAFFRRYAAEMKLVSFSPSEDVSGSFSIRENGSFHVDYRSGRPPEYSDTSGEGSFTGVIRLSDWVFALVPGAVQWASLEDEFVLQEVMLFQIPGAKEDDPGILKTDLQNIASLTKADPQSPVPFCFIRAFDNSPLWAGTAGKELLPQNSPERTSHSGSAEAALAQILQEHESAIHAFQKLRLQTWEGTDLLSCLSGRAGRSERGRESGTAVSGNERGPLVLQSIDLVRGYRYPAPPLFPDRCHPDRRQRFDPSGDLPSAQRQHSDRI